MPLRALFEASLVSEKEPPTYRLSPLMTNDMTGALRPLFDSAASAPLLKATMFDAPEAEPFVRENTPPRKTSPDACCAAAAIADPEGDTDDDPPSALNKSNPALSRPVIADVGIALLALTVVVLLSGHSKNPKPRSAIVADELLLEDELDVMFELVRMN